MICIRNLFEPISFINRTNSRQIWTPTCEDIDHNAKSPSFGPPKKNPHKLNFFHPPFSPPPLPISAHVTLFYERR